MEHSLKAISLIQSCEGCKLTTYADQGGLNTIGYGHTGSFATPGNTITQEQAVTLLNGDIAITDHAVTRLVKVALNQPQFDALVSLTFNIGQGNFANSTVLKLLNLGHTTLACAHFMDWVKAAGVTDQGLVNRRKKEQALFMEAEGG